MKSNKLSASDFFAVFLTAFIAGNTTTAALGDFRDLNYIDKMSLVPFWAVFAAVSAVLLVSVFVLKTARITNYALLLFSVSYAVLLCSYIQEEIYFNIGVCFVLIFILKYLTDENRLGLDDVDKLIDERASVIITAVIFLVFTVFVSIYTVLSHLCFANATFDFGIFCQMFEQMAKTGLPFTTVERSEYLSHFAVHFSPVYYLVLPFYMIFRSPEFLLVVQAIVVGLGVFPIRRIALRLGLSPFMAAMTAAIYALFPTMANGCFYDFHENKFLSVFILYTVYFVLKNNNIGILVFSLLTLSVKEDAAIYIIAIALWMFISRKKRLMGISLAAIAVCYFVFACKMIELSGGGIMMSRLDNYYADPNGSFIDVIKTLFYDIGYLIREVFFGADMEGFPSLTYEGQKLEFVIWLCAPLCFMSFASKKISHLTLLIPLLVINLMPSWLYQYNVDYQYTYGSAALVIVCAFLAIAERRLGKIRKYLAICLVLCLVFTASLVYPKAVRYSERYSDNKEAFELTESTLDIIPRDSSVTAYGFFVPYLAYIDDLHSCPDYYAPYEKTDYYVIDIRYQNDSHTKKMFEAMGSDYELVAEGGYAAVYKLRGAE